MASIRIFNPDGLAVPRSPFMQVARVKANEFAFIAGQVPVDPNGGIVGKGDFDMQCACVYDNIHRALRSVDADWGNVVEFTSYLVRAEDRAAFAAFRRGRFAEMFPGGAYPPNTLLIIDKLAHEDYLLEISAVAAL